MDYLQTVPLTYAPYAGAVAGTTNWRKFIISGFE